MRAAEVLGLHCLYFDPLANLRRVLCQVHFSSSFSSKRAMLPFVMMFPSMFQFGVSLFSCQSLPAPAGRKAAAADQPLNIGGEERLPSSAAFTACRATWQDPEYRRSPHFPTEEIATWLGGCVCGIRACNVASMRVQQAAAASWSCSY